MADGPRCKRRKQANPRRKNARALRRSPCTSFHLVPMFARFPSMHDTPHTLPHAIPN
ncbi:hypothetical protein Baya_4788 [Bagarius yarrelli]|uniref:Zinc finger E-box-binding homeobox 2 n=1 Tax=Bagarius yarrelli TaxID=175774 RepID=A0A556TTI5_BAGYA|nr:hypothetical protein Baya_4788 [Bagarius yarrelli]